jgi:PIN domain nuclease of toxin-antitoxin system
MARRFVLTVLATALALALGVIAFNAWVDPFQHYRKAERFPARFYPAWQRHQNPGLAKHYAFDRIVTGSSRTENIVPADVDRILGGRTINLSVSAQSAYDAARLLRVALGTGKARHVVMSLDYNTFSGAPDRSGFTEPFPGYLNDDARWNDLPYVLGIGTLRKSLETALGLRWTRFHTDPQRMWYWAEGVQFSAAKVVQALDPVNLNAQFRQPPRDLEGMKASFEANLAPLIQAHPATRFTFVYAPYSILVWLDFQQRGQLEVTLAFREWLQERLQRHPNAETHDLHAEPSIVMNLDHFTDIYHYSPAIDRVVIEALAHGRHKLTARAVRENNAWLRKAVGETTPQDVIAAARARQRVSPTPPAAPRATP